jgi:protein-S-isoprenylcysteine O-methyltransferase Ste14
MLEYIIWGLITLYFLNRMIGWWILVYSMKWHWYGKVVVIITSIILLSLPFSPQPRLYDIGLLLFILGIIIGIIILLFGLIIMILSDKEFHKIGTRPDSMPTKLATTGVYSIVRHPQYIGLNLSFLGWSLIWGAIYCLFLIPVVILLNWLQAFLEEKYLLEKLFGDEFRKYKKKVGMFLPKISKKN